MILWILLMLSAFASELPSALPEPYRQWWDDSAQLETQGRLEGALVKVRVVRRGQPDFMPALLAEARLLVALTPTNV